jgi:RNA polymerase sigma factor (sigma-70 family)
MESQTPDILSLLHACGAGDVQARSTFQQEYGEDIYNFPVKIYGLPVESAGDFYVYVFEKDRIFTRLRTFEGRNHIQFRTFLSYYALKDLFLEWRRGFKELETISLNTPVDSSGEGERVLEDILPNPEAAEGEEVDFSEGSAVPEIWSSLSPQERLDLKLLYLIESDLDPEDVRLLAKTSGRSLRDTLALIAEVRAGLRRKDEKLSRLQDELDSVWGWIRLRQKELQEIDEKIHLIAEKGEESGREKLLTQKRELEQSLTKRQRQQERIVKEMSTFKLTTPYKDIARLLNLTVGTVCSRIFRVRERVVGESGETGVQKE